MSLEHFVGTATVISSLAGRFVGYPAQIRLILKTRMVGNLSVTLHTIGFISCLLWTWHGWLNGDWVILLTQGLAGIAATGSMLFLIWRFRPRAVAQAALGELVVGLCALDGVVHPREREQAEAFAGKWHLSLPWRHAEAVAEWSPTTRGEHILSQLERYLAHASPVEQWRELHDLLWIIVEADGEVTAAERQVAAAGQTRLQQALASCGALLEPLFRVVMVTAGTDLADGTRAGVQISDVALTERVARRHAADLRKSGMVAFAVPDSDLSGEHGVSTHRFFKAN